MGRQSLAAKAARKSPSAITESRTEAIEQMNTSLRRVFTRIEKSVNDLRAENLRYYHRIGSICEDIRSKPEEYVGKDGTAGLKLIEQALSTQARTLRKAAEFAREYTDEQLQQLLDLKNPDTGFQLHWGHVSFLLTLPNAEKRDKYAAEAVEKMLDPPALHDLIKKRTQRKAGHGRKHEMPKTINAQIRQILTFCKAWIGKNTDVWNGVEESVFGNILNMAPDDMEPDMVTQLEEVATLMQTVSESANENIAKAQRVREHLAAAITKRDQEAAAGHASDGRQTRAIDIGDGSPRVNKRNRGVATAAT